MRLSSVLLNAVLAVRSVREPGRGMARNCRATPGVAQRIAGSFPAPRAAAPLPFPSSVFLPGVHGRPGKKSDSYPRKRRKPGGREPQETRRAKRGQK